MGYLKNGFESTSLSRASLFIGLGKPGEDERGSNGGSKEGAGRFLLGEIEADAGGSVGSSAVTRSARSIILTGEDVMMKGQECMAREMK